MTDILIGIDSGTSVIKAVAFDLAGRQLAACSVPNIYQTGADGSATQSLTRTWQDCARALQGLGAKVPGLAVRTAAVSVTAQGDGTWLAGKGNAPVGDAWLWLDARAAPTVERLASGGLNRGRFEAAGLLAGTPVSLGYVDMVMTALGAGVYSDQPAACSTVGSTGVHMRSTDVAGVHLNAGGTGYVICLPVPGMVTQVQTNMAASLNIDWLLRMAAELMADLGKPVKPADLVPLIGAWVAASPPGALIYHPYISEAGERGPFVNAHARAGFIGLSSSTRFADLLRAVVEGLGMAMRDCYAAIGAMPEELQLTGGAARSKSLRGVLAAAVNAPVRVSSREEAGAAAAAMMAAVAVGVYPTMQACVAEWVTPLLGEAEAPDPDLAGVYARLYPSYQQARQALGPAWAGLSALREARGAK